MACFNAVTVTTFGTRTGIGIGPASMHGRSIAYSTGGRPAQHNNITPPGCFGPLTVMQSRNNVWPGSVWLKTVYCIIAINWQVTY